MAKHVLQELIESSEYGDDCRPYSGRGMGGKQCLGVVCESMPKLFASLMEALSLNPTYDPDQSTQERLYEVNANEVDALIAGMRNAKDDPMDLNIIVYFPHIKYVHDRPEYLEAISKCDLADEFKAK